MLVAHGAVLGLVAFDDRDALGSDLLAGAELCNVRPASLLPAQLSPLRAWRKEKMANSSKQRSERTD